MNMITEKCTGCRACEQLCPKKCISLQADDEGFLQTVIEETECVHCGLCERICPQNHLPEKSAPLRVVAARYKDDEVLKRSASGGVFAGVARRVIRRGGAVFGLTYDENWRAGHKACHTLEELSEQQSSKYVQADTGDTYAQVKELLEEGKTVLYSGTGCQIGGLRAFLRKEYANLITMDLICHGVSSPLLFRKYIGWLGGKMNGKVLAYNFRDKSEGWGLGYKTKTKTKTKTLPSTLDPYYYNFLKGSNYRECCYDCRYCTKERISDMTIGDYWGIEKEHPKFYSTKGVSVVLLNTRKGTDCYSECEGDFLVCESEFEKAVRKNHNLIRPTQRTEQRDSIYARMDAPDYFDTVLAPPRNLKNSIKGLLPMEVKLILKKIKQRFL